MKRSHVLFLVGVSAAGTLSGYGLRRAVSGSTAVPALEHPGDSGSFARTGSTSATAQEERFGSLLVADIPQRRSEDTLESVLALDPDAHYGRIALWLATADESQLAAYWEGYKSGKRTVQVTDLVFINWTRRNPQAAVAAVAGTGDERYAWWSWACNDPEAALTAGKLAGRDQMSQVAYGIGDFHPDWLRKNIDSIPEEFRRGAFDRMRNWPAGMEPLETLEFNKAQGMQFDERVFANLVKQDPWSALDWMRGNKHLNPDRFGRGNDTMADLLVSTLAKESPEDLEKLAAEMPAGQIRRKMEQALFDKLLETDPDKAMEEARNTKVPLLAAQRLGQIGLNLMAEDPEKAFAIAKEAISASPGALNADSMVYYPGGGSGYHSASKANDLLSALFSKDRERTMNLLVPEAGNSGSEIPSETLSSLSNKWLEDDPEGFSSWAGQTEGKVKETAASLLSYHLAQRGHFEEAVEWAGASSRDPGSAYGGVLHYWKQSDPDGAAVWLENSSLTEAQKESYREILNQK